MSISARKFVTHKIITIVALFLLAFTTTVCFPLQKTYAQSAPQSQSQQTLNEFRIPDTDSTVPKNTHAYTQILLIDILSAITCQLTGIDPVMPSQPCIGFNPLTGKFGAAQQRIEDKPQLGGALGVLAQQIGVLYQKPASSKTYFDYLSANFGIVKPAYAQQTNCNSLNNSAFGYGYCGLNPIFEIWKLARDFAYALLVIAFVVLALGIMLRFKIDARTVMTLQNQIPRVIIAIILITFSYAIAGVMVDLMWTVTYMGMDAITSASSAKVCLNGTNPPISNAAQQYLLETPLRYVDSIFADDCNSLLGSKGLIMLANDTGGAIGNIITDLIFNAFGSNFNAASSDCSFTNIGDCFKKGIALIISLIIKLIVVITLIITLIRLWFNLLKTVVLFIVYALEGPIYIVFGLLPGRPLGFEKWLRLIFAHLVPFPLVAWALTFARVLSASYSVSIPNPNTVFVPPLIGNPNMNNFGILLAFGLILITPGIPDTIKERLKVPGGKMGGMIRGGLAGGGAVVAASTGAGWKRMTRKYDPETEKEAGILRQAAFGRPFGLGMRGDRLAKDAKTGEYLNPTRRYKWFKKLTGGTFGTRDEHKRR